jgi:hypothetical protein
VAERQHCRQLAVAAELRLMTCRSNGASMSSPPAKLHEVEDRYAPDDERPLGGYLATLSGYATAVGGLTALLARRGGPPERLAGRDLALAGLASFRASRLITEASVTAPLRAPFTRYAGSAGPGEVNEEVQSPDGGHRHAIGELVTCPYCFGMWTATAFAFGLALAPRWTRFVASVFAIDAGSDIMQKLYSDLQAR